MINRQRGKRAQKKIAERLNALNIGTLGKVDLLHEEFIVEVKDRAKFIGDNFLKQAEKYTKDFPNKIPISIVHIRGTRYDNSIVLIRLKDFVEVINGTIRGGGKIPDK